MSVTQNCGPGTGSICSTREPLDMQIHDPPSDLVSNNFGVYG